MVFRPARRFPTIPFPPCLSAACLFGSVILPHLLFFVIRNCPFFPGFLVPGFSIGHTLHYWLAVVYTICHKGQFHPDFLPLCAHELRVLPITPFTPLIEGNRSGLLPTLPNILGTQKRAVSNKVPTARIVYSTLFTVYYGQFSSHSAVNVTRSSMSITPSPL
jgi:hypothetical protein